MRMSSRSPLNEEPSFLCAARGIVRRKAHGKESAARGDKQDAARVRGKTPCQAVGGRALQGGRRLAGSSRTPCAIVRTLRRWHRIGHAARGSPPPPAAVSQSVRKEGRREESES